MSFQLYLAQRDFLGKTGHDDEAVSPSLRPHNRDAYMNTGRARLETRAYRHHHRLPSQHGEDWDNGCQVANDN